MITCQAADPVGGLSQTATVSVGVAPIPVITGFTATPTRLTAGGATTLAWSTTGAVQVQLKTDTNGTVSYRTLAASGTLAEVPPSATGASLATTYSLTAANAAGAITTLLFDAFGNPAPAAATVIVDPVPAPVLTDFLAFPAYVAPGTSATLIGSYQNGTATLDHGLGTLPNSDPALDPALRAGVAVATTASSVSTAYTVTVANGAGQAITGSASLGVLGGGSFNPIAGMVTFPRFAHTATLVTSGTTRLLLAAGGWDQNQNLQPFIDLLDLSTLSSLVFPMPHPRAFHTATLLPNGTVLLAGGYDGSGPVAALDIFDPSTLQFASNQGATPGTWAHPAAQHTASLLPNGQVLLAGGMDAQGNATDATALVTVSGSGASTVITCVPGPNLAAARTGHTATTLADGSVLIAGGTSAAGNLDQAERIVPNAPAIGGVGLPQPLPPMKAARFGHVAVALADGTVLLAGGDGQALDATGQAVGIPAQSSAERFDPTLGAHGDFQPVACPLAEGRTFAVGCPLPNGTVLLTGGLGANGTLASAEIYLPSLGGFRTVPAAGYVVTTAGMGASMAGARSFHTATVLPDGRVLVLGGVGADGATIPAPEMYVDATATTGGSTGTGGTGTGGTPGPGPAPGPAPAPAPGP